MGERLPCQGLMPLFYSHGAPEILAAKAKCSRCPATTECLQRGIDLEHRTGHVNGTGIYGGLTERERHQLRGRQP